MARLPRFFVPDLPLHIIQRGNNRVPIFGNQMDFAFFHRQLTTAARTHGVAVHAYVLMTNHFHLLGTPRLPTSVPKMMQLIGCIYAMYFNGRYGRTGALWDGRYRATIVEDDRYLLTCMRYIELNPVRAGIVSSAREYCWSSFAANAMGRLDRLVTRHPLYQDLGHSPDVQQRAYRALFDTGLPEGALSTIRDATHNGWALGTKGFTKRVSLSGRRGKRLPPGRPNRQAIERN